MLIRNINKKSGFTLIELVVYMAGLLALGSVLILMIVQFYGLYKEIIAVPRADRTGLILVDRITKEIRSATAIDVINSQFDTTDGELTLTLVNNGDNIQKRFYVENGAVFVQEDNGSPVSLSSNDFNVSNFNFYFVPTTVSQGVRFVLELEYESREGLQTKQYSGFAILRESYE
jgi:hypothetical protein